MPEAHTTMTASQASASSLPPEPAKRSRRLLEGPDRDTFTVHLKTLALILGGAPRTREVDTVDISRGPTVRGHLLFWWRALYAHEFDSASKLARRERALWGGAGNDEGSRSLVLLQDAQFAKLLASKLISWVLFENATVDPNLVRRICRQGRFQGENLEMFRLNRSSRL